jgi:hypothetical protein
VPPADNPIEILGYRELMRAFAQADKDSRKYVRAAFREVGQPVAAEAEQLAVQKIPRITRRSPRGPKWEKMRVGVTRTLVYVAPRQRGVRSGPRRRPNMADLLMGRAMEPALEHNEARLEASVERALDLVADRFNAGGAA